MSPLEWILSLTLFAFYIMLLLTVCGLTFKKGYLILGIAGIFLPFLWLIGAMLPPKAGSRAALEEEMYAPYKPSA